MKNVFKKNQIIISALAIMIAVAGYLNFTKDKTGKEVDANLNSALNQGQTTGDADQGNEENALTADIGKENEFADISDEDILKAKGENGVLVGDNGELLVSESDKTADGTKGNGKEESLTASNEKTDESKETSNTGEAVLASTTLGSGFFSNAKLTREQNRAKEKEMLMDIIADTTIAETQKQAAIDSVIAMTATAEKENAAELLLEAKGFEGAVVNIVEGNVDVVVNSPQITEQQLAQIEDIVMRKTGAEASNIVITSVIVEE